MAGETILLVEDHPTNLQLAVFLLKAAGFSVVSAETAAEAIELAKRELPALVLMDVELPGMDGLTATRRLKADRRTAAIPVVALTANAMRGDQEKCLEAGCAGYISKPVNAKTFAATVRQYLTGTP